MKLFTIESWCCFAQDDTTQAQREQQPAVRLHVHEEKEEADRGQARTAIVAAPLTVRGHGAATPISSFLVEEKPNPRAHR